MRPGFVISLMPVLLLIALLSVCVAVFHDAMLQGPSQMVLMFATAVVCAFAMLRYRHSWQELEDSMVQGIGRTMPANIILLLVGALCGTWMHSGVIPTMIYYGLDIMSARWLLLTACLVCAVVSVCIGSSWTTIATVGVGLMGIGRTLGIDDALVAGAIISGAYFGDKMSPLSETTNLAASTSGVPLFEHIRNMLHTTVPSMLITLVVFLAIGLCSDFVDGDIAARSAQTMQEQLSATFVISPWLLLLPLLVFYLIYRGISAIVVLFVGTVAAALILPLVQPQLVPSICHDSQASGFLGGFEASMRASFGAVDYGTGNEAVDGLVSTAGMRGMLNTVWLIICSMCFGGAMETSGMLASLTQKLLRVMRNRFASVSAACVSSFFLNCTTGDQCLAIILPAKMYGEAFDHQHLPRKILSRSLEDGGTVTSVLVPWNSCGMMQSSVLGVMTLAYAPFAIFCWLSPLVSMLVSALPEKWHRSKRNVNERF